ncbi:MAG: hypothetical protein OEY91_15525, partial [Nitrospirota bacterium]|nr:hypothetical protein [Nitrospirota bacterium]
MMIARYRALSLGLMVCCSMLFPPLVAQATMGWEVGDMVLDFGLNLEPGEQVVLIDKYEVGHPFFVELTWKLNSAHCLLQVKEATGGGDLAVT